MQSESTEYGAMGEDGGMTSRSFGDVMGQDVLVAGLGGRQVSLQLFQLTRTRSAAASEAVPI